MTGVLTERRRKIMDLVAEHGKVGVSELAEMFGVTAVTARADLAALEDGGYIVRTHGGAVSAFHPGILARMHTNREVKAAIAKAAAGLIRDGESVVVTAGTTTALIPKYLNGKRDIHMVTNNTLMLTYARNNPQLRVTLLGGDFRPDEEGVVGSLALRAVEQFHVTKAFVGVDGASVRQGFTANSIESADFVRKMAEQADEVIVVADSGKFGEAGFARILPFEGVDSLVTDQALRAEFEMELRKADVKIIKA